MPDGFWVKTRNGQYRHPVNSPPNEDGAVKMLRCQRHPLWVVPTEDESIPECPRCLNEIALDNLMGEV